MEMESCSSEIRESLESMSVLKCAEDGGYHPVHYMIIAGTVSNVSRLKVVHLVR